MKGKLMKTISDVSALFPTEGSVPERHALTAPLHQQSYLVKGEIRSWSGPAQDVLSPICFRQGNELKQASIGSYPLMGEAEAMDALAAAAKAFDKGRGDWPTMTVADRIACVEKFAFRMLEKRDAVVRLLMWEIGKTLKDAEKEFDRTVEYIRDSVEALKDIDRASSRFVIEQGIIAQIRRAPLGVVLCMGPFNYPLNETFTTLIPALMMGNTVIFKPPKLGVLLHEPLLEAFRDSFPPGVVNTIYGEGQKVISPVMASGGVDVLAFIGSCRVANALKKQHPRPNRLKCILGLEAKNAGIVLEDSDLDLAVKECVTGALSYNGQRCTALKMLFIHEDVIDDLMSRLVTAVGRLKCGMPWEADVNLTPLPEPGKPGKLAELVEDAVRLGGRVVNEGGGLHAGTFYYPAVVCPVEPASRLYCEEQFGPVVAVRPFRDVAEPIRYVEESRYGQQVSIFGRDPERIAALVDPLVNQVCRVNINSQCQRGPDVFPFTGRKDSAEATLSVSDALRVFAIRTLVAAKADGANKELLSRITRERKSRFISTDFLF
ncbi:MAG TPA: NADP-dependent glyceraldehyde-3-phosphate dehydrogenase [Candidatus Brocadiia bacterium]|nr:NADP-dependent glyceraldehyde-3-phosphate dehydrogenase [Candidatus Brocadiia bacterium]